MPLSRTMSDRGKWGDKASELISRHAGTPGWTTQTKIPDVSTTTWKKIRHYERSSWFARATQILHQLQEIKQLPPALPKRLPQTRSWLLLAGFLGLGALFSLIPTYGTQVLFCCGAVSGSRVSSGKVPKAHQAINTAQFFKQARNCRRPSETSLGVLFCPRHQCVFLLGLHLHLFPILRRKKNRDVWRTVWRNT